MVESGDQVQLEAQPVIHGACGSQPFRDAWFEVTLCPDPFAQTRRERLPGPQVLVEFTTAVRRVQRMPWILVLKMSALSRRRPKLIALPSSGL
jgi:hypothetical protein